MVQQKFVIRNLLDSTINLSEGVSNITGFQLDKTVASSEFAYYILMLLEILILNLKVI